VGLLDLPHDLLARLDRAGEQVLPPLARVVLWALLAALLTMELYRLLSPQDRLAALKGRSRAARQRLNGYAGSFAGAWPLITEVVGLALRHIALVLPATLGTAIPLLVLVVYLHTTYSYRFPGPGETAAIILSEPGYQGHWQAPGPGPGRAVVTDRAGRVVVAVAPRAPVPELGKWRYWNLLLGNPAGYLPSAAPIDRLQVQWPRRELLGSGPAWLRGWAPTFLLALFLFALEFKIVRRIE